MVASSARQDFHGIDWHTTHAALAKVLGALDTMQTLLLGFGEIEMPEQEQLNVLADLAAETRVDLDFVAAETLGGYPRQAASLQTAWAFVEADELMLAFFYLAHEARAAMRHQKLNAMPENVALDLSELVRRVKLLLTGLEETPARLMAIA